MSEAQDIDTTKQELIDTLQKKINDLSDTSDSFQPIPNDFILENGDFDEESYNQAVKQFAKSSISNASAKLATAIIDVLYLTNIPNSPAGSVTNGGKFTFGGIIGDKDTHTEPTNSNVYSALKTVNALTALQETIQEGLEHKFLRKDIDDTVSGTLTFQKLQKFLGGWLADNFSKATSGAGLYKDDNGNWHLQAEYIQVLRKFIAEEIEVQHTSHIGGKVILTAADMICVRVEETDAYYRCYMRTKDGEGREIKNEWKVNDLALCETFNLEKQLDGTLGNHFYWRKVVNVKDDYIDLSKSICADSSDIPLVDDSIVQLGYTDNDDKDRQNAQILCGAGEGSPYIKQYVGINTFNLPDEETRLKPGDNLFKGDLIVSAGSVNLLLNSGFTGNYENLDLSNTTLLDNDTQLFSNALDKWEGNATVNNDNLSTSDKSATITSSLSQSIELIQGEKYVLSFKAKGSNITVSCGELNEAITLISNYEEYVLRFKASDSNATLMLQGDCTICNIQLERGTIATAYKANPLDNSKTVEKFKELEIFQHAISDASAQFIGGLGLMQTILLGMFKNGVMQKVTAGISGIYNDDEDVAFWGGGTLEQAIKTVRAFKDNPLYSPTDDEWSNMAKFVVTHGGDAIFRGTVFADSGYFRGLINIANGMYILNPDGTAKLGNIDIDKKGHINIEGLTSNNEVWELDFNKYRGKKNKTEIENFTKSDGDIIRLNEDATIDGMDYMEDDCIIYKDKIGWFKVYGLEISDFTTINGKDVFSVVLYLNAKLMQNINFILTDDIHLDVEMGRASYYKGSVINITCTSSPHCVAGISGVRSLILSKDDGSSAKSYYKLTALNNDWIVEGGMDGYPVEILDDILIDYDNSTKKYIPYYGSSHNAYSCISSIYRAKSDDIITNMSGKLKIEFVNGAYINLLTEQSSFELNQHMNAMPILRYKSTNAIYLDLYSISDKGIVSTDGAFRLVIKANKTITI